MIHKHQIRTAITVLGITFLIGMITGGYIQLTIDILKCR